MQDVIVSPLEAKILIFLSEEHALEEIEVNDQGMFNPYKVIAGRLNIPEKNVTETLETLFQKKLIKSYARVRVAQNSQHILPKLTSPSGDKIIRSLIVRN